MTTNQFFIRSRNDGSRDGSGHWVGWDVINGLTGKPVLEHTDYDYADEAQAAADRLNERL